MSPAKRRERRKRSNASYRRKGATRDPRPLVLIVCEGAKTEPKYLKALWSDLRLRSTKIEIVGGEESGTHPKSIVQHARTKQRELRAEGQQYDRIWVVFDRDEHEGLSAAIDRARALKFCIAFSNPCFELWYILHFRDQTAHIDRHDALAAVKKLIPGYNRAANVYPHLNESESQLTDATDRAKALRTRHRGNGDDPTSNPSTTVDELVDYLHSLKEK